MRSGDSPPGRGSNADFTPSDLGGPVTDVLLAPGLRPTLGVDPTAAGWPKVRGYDVLSVLGSGGMGIVYKARHRELRRTVALKTLRGAALSDPEFVNRFRAEAEAVARLQHPHVIQVFEVGTAEPRPGEMYPTPFIALEFVSGGSLSRYTDKPQPAEFAARVVEKVARAAHAAHRFGVVHRDLKPANVLLTHDGEPKVADFGLAKQLAPEHDAAGRFVTQAGVAMGTPEYMAPEQCSGAAPAPAMDVYALGVMLYELLTGRVPFHAASPVETMALARQQDPVPPRRLQPTVPRDLETVCLQCLEKAPGKRYESAAALADDLRAFLDHRPIRARPIGTVGRTVRWAGRNPLAAAMMAAVVAVGLIGLAGVLLKWRDAVAHATAADRSAADARDHARAERWERYRANIVASAAALQVYNVGSARRTLEAAPEEHRAWEWRHFHSRLDGARQVIRGVDGPVNHLGISPDGRRVAQFADGDQIRLWDVPRGAEVARFHNNRKLWGSQISADGRRVAYEQDDHSVVVHDLDADRVAATLRGHEKNVHWVEFAGNSRVLTASEDLTLRVWDTTTGKAVWTMRPHAGYFVVPCVSPDGRLVVTAPRDAGDSARLWDLETGRQIATLDTARRKFLGGGFSPGGDRFLTVDAFPSNSVRLWDAATGRLISEQAGHTNTINHLAFSADGRRVATGSMDHTVRLWDGVTGQPVATLQGHSGWVHAVAFSPDGSRLLSASQDHTVRVWDVAAAAERAVLYGHTNAVLGAAYTADGSEIVTAAKDGTIRRWDARAAERNGVLRGHTTFVYGVAFHPDGRRVASAGWDGSVRVWDATSGRQTALLPHAENAVVSSVAFHPGGQLVASRARDAVRLWDLASGKQVHHWPVPADNWRDTRLAFSPQGDLLAAGGADRTVRLWDVTTRAEVAVLRGHTDEVRDVAFSPDGRWLATAGENEDRTVRIWDVAAKAQAHVLTGHTQAVYALAFNAAGTRLASGSTDGTARLWDTATWTAVGQPLKHGTNVYGVAFTPDGTRLACACADNSIRLWDPAAQQEVAELRGHGMYVHHLAFSPDGSRLVSASGDQTVRVWDTVRPQDRGR